MEEQAAKLMETLNNAILTGVDKLPNMAQISLDAIGAYAGARVLYGVVVTVCAVLLAGTAAYLTKKACEETEYQAGQAAGALAFGVTGLISFFVGTAIISSSFAAWVSPLGWVLKQAVQ